MNRIKVNNRHLWNFYVFPLMFFTTVACFPTSRPDLEAQPEIRDEKHFPNGTVVGRYTYMDNEGNPIQVKYYADDASYGVELKSIKVVDSTGDSSLVSAVSANTNSQISPNSQPNKLDFNLIRNVESDAKMSSTNMLHANTNMPMIEAGQSGAKYRINEPIYNFPNREGTKTNRYKVEKPNPDYEIFYQNELKGPKKCNKDKVRVYFDKENRNIRSVSVNSFEADKFCEQF
ncbi:uncharacterized protein LOC124630488 [Helicoverpa zea]|uniref:uncharacterized protein LOC124630488 n=1 Tax=Helicoverpa zea TaxID=7113 RepID=UPI001F58AA41|nr:uncharacterized protein LOC124630488 [Helicoverpa zea]